MRHIFFCLLLLPLLAGCGGPSVRNTSSPNAGDERDNPGRYLQVNYEVRRNLVGRKVVEGQVINTGKFQTWKAVTLRITAYEDGDANNVNLTIDEAIAPGGKSQLPLQARRKASARKSECGLSRRRLALLR